MFSSPTVTRRLVTLRLTHGVLPGQLLLPDYPVGIVIFAHGSGSSANSPRNRFVADQLVALGLGALLFDLLTPHEAGDRANVFNIPLLARRLVLATDWIGGQPNLSHLPVGYFGASTGAAAALVASTTRSPRPVAAVVSRGGRPDLAGSALEQVTAPTLLLVGGDDVDVLQLNRAAYARIRGMKELQVVPGATHLFEEPGTLETVAREAARWFAHYLAAPLRGGTS